MPGLDAGALDVGLSLLVFALFGIHELILLLLSA
jgi:hypothetical protein